MAELERVHSGIALADRPVPPATLVVFDLDRFKTVSDSYGHVVGDTVLQAARRAVEGTLRSSDILGRIGGEEFAVLLRDCEPADALSEECVQRSKLLLWWGIRSLGSDWATCSWSDDG